ncbi:hypothetical protein T10_4434 [Trichinella papuae]|uniref:Uncharacterized protein n=1 Tax=Trichinella papuae TaxID=268474 RepID=A0A0V1NA65_9BILA|nr:hypothetical protein T10_4434 [Trichinella papuae]
MCSDSPENWDELLPWIMLAYIRVAPFVASLGKELRLPLDMQLRIAPGSEQHVNEFLRNNKQTTGRSQEETVTNYRKNGDSRKRYLII